MAFARFVCVSIALLSGCEARAFRGDAPVGHESFSEAVLQQTLLEEIQGAYGSISQRGRLNRIEATLAPMYTALPKNEHGKLGHATVRYALHRIFVQRHGWFIKGLEPGGQHFNSSSPTGVLKEHVSAHVEELFEKRLGAQGFSLHDTAVLAATLEHLIHTEAEGRLSKAYASQLVEKDSPLTTEKGEKLLDLYMKYYLLTDELAEHIPDDEMRDIFPGWDETKKFTREIMTELTPRGVALDFAKMMQIVEEVGERFGRFQNGECSSMKTKLVGLGDQDIGRVPLRDFYRSSLNGTTFEFQESPSYLKQLGVLDENDNVIVSNYVGSHTNCIASSNLYSVCCMDECESLMGKLEHEIAAPEATPQQIMAMVSGMPSSSVDAPRNLPTKLVDRLEDAAQSHGGTVQLHGRLFAQWMHHAYPRECPFPHVSGTIAPVTPDEWLESQGNDGYATPAEMLVYTKSAEAKNSDEVMEHWIDHEELLVPATRARRSSSTMHMILLAMVALGVATSMKSIMPVDSVLEALAAMQGKSCSKADLLPVFSGKSHML